MLVLCILFGATRVGSIKEGKLTCEESNSQVISIPYRVVELGSLELIEEEEAYIEVLIVSNSF